MGLVETAVWFVGGIALSRLARQIVVLFFEDEYSPQALGVWAFIVLTSISAFTLALHV